MTKDEIIAELKKVRIKNKIDSIEFIEDETEAPQKINKKHKLTPKTK